MESHPVAKEEGCETCFQPVSRVNGDDWQVFSKVQNHPVAAKILEQIENDKFKGGKTTKYGHRIVKCIILVSANIHL